MKPELTERQAEVLGYIRRYIRKYKYPPSVRAIADRFDIQVQAVFDHLKALESRGAIRREKGLHRALVVLD